jgi:hypothetical protein
MKNLLIAAAMMLATATFAQTYNEEIDMLQAMYGKQKKEIVAEFINPQGTQADAFWALYDQYEAERKIIGVQRINLIGIYAEYYNNLDDGGTDVLVKEMLKLVKSNDGLIEKYYGKLKKKAGTKAAAQFVQIEHYLLSTIRAGILEEIPFIGELE